MYRPLIQGIHVHVSSKTSSTKIHLSNVARLLRPSLSDLFNPFEREANPMEEKNILSVFLSYLGLNIIKK
jgi:hypothetical protein